MKVIVLGAGPAGMSAAYFAQALGHQVVVIEKASLVGGKGASRREGDYILDFGPHAYHPKTGEIDTLMRRHAGDDFLLTPVNQKLVLHGETMSYPFRIAEGLTKFSPLFSAGLLLGYLRSRLSNLVKELPEDSFEAYGVKHFGRPLYELCFGNYTRRVWGMPPDRLSGELARRKLPKFSISGVIRDSLTGQTERSHAHLFGKLFGYHRRGIGAVYENIARGITERGGEVLLDERIEALTLGAEGGVSQVVVGGRSPREIPCDCVISTIPIPALTALLPRPSSSLQEAAEGLGFRDILLVYAFLKREAFSPAHWFYLVDERFNFSRMSEQKNLTSACCPSDRTVLSFEISLTSGRDCSLWPADQLLDLVLKDLEYFRVGPSDIERIESCRLEDAYPVFVRGYAESLEAFLREIGRIPNLISTGRQGLFRDIDMHDAMYLGKLAAEHAAKKRPWEFYESCEASLGEAKRRAG